MSIHQADMARRRVFCILNPRSLSYARFALESLFRNVDEPIHLDLITDSEDDKSQLMEEVSLRHQTGNHTWTVSSESDLADLEAAKFSQFPNLRLFRKGHPCWRKITDPLLLTESGEEMVLLDPDLYFPNRFRFEPTPEQGVLLMWQRPNCLVPAHVVKKVMQMGIKLAHHVDIGVGQWRAPVDLEWMDWLLGRLDCATLPRVMHIEAIMWSAIAVRIGGGYLNPDAWHCWRRSQWKRLQLKLGVSGTQILRSENFAGIKCFHAGGEAKNWLAKAKDLGMLDFQNDCTDPSPILPFVPLAPQAYYREQRLKSILRKMGYHSIFQSV